MPSIVNSDTQGRGYLNKFLMQTSLGKKVQRDLIELASRHFIEVKVSGLHFMSQRCDVLEPLFDHS